MIWHQRPSDCCPHPATLLSPGQQEGSMATEALRPLSPLHEG
jgi:hypothetical protein